MSQADKMNTDHIKTEDLSMLFHRAAKLMLRGQQRPGQGMHAQGRILSILKDNGPLAQRELLNITQVRSGSLSELLGKMEQSGYVARSTDTQDKRSFVVDITDKGRMILAEHEKWRKERSKRLFDILSKTEQEQFGSILNKLIIAWEETTVKHPSVCSQGCTDTSGLEELTAAKTRRTCTSGNCKHRNDT